MVKSSPIEIDLHLQNIDQFFIDPELNPFKTPRLQVSGIEEAVNNLRMRKRVTGPISLNIFLPRSQIDPDLKKRTKDALAQYCDFRISQNQLQLKIERAEGWRAVLIGLIFSGICLLMILTVHLIGTLVETGFIVFAGFFTILIWMAIWNPAEIFLFWLQPYKLAIRNYGALRNAEVIIKEES